MEIADVTGVLMEQLPFAAFFLEHEILLAAFLFVGTACVIATCVPGLLMPISFSAGMLMDSISPRSADSSNRTQAMVARAPSTASG